MKPYCKVLPLKLLQLFIASHLRPF